MLTGPEMESDVKISVIVVTYNQEKTIGRTLDHILSQRLDGVRYEIIIGDDASTDGTGEVCARYAALHPDRIVYLRRERNMGVTANYFDCIARARGEYLADCAGDDFWTDDLKLRRQADILDRCPEVSLVATDWLCRDTATGVLSRHPANPRPAGIERFAPGALAEAVLSGERTIHLCTALYRRALIESAVEANRDIFIDPLYSCEDLQILLRMATAGEIVILPEVTLHYSVGHESVSHQQDYGRRFEYSLRSMRQSLRLQKFFDIGGPRISRANARILNHLAAMALRAGPEERGSRAATRPARLRRFVKRKNLRLPLKARLYSGVMRCGPLWRLTAALRRSRQAWTTHRR